MGAVMAERLDLPEPIAAYFAADKRDIEAIAQCFTKDAVVKDEGHTYTGVMAIKQWKAKTSPKYTYPTERLALEHPTGPTSIQSRLTVTFPAAQSNPPLS